MASVSRAPALRVAPEVVSALQDGRAVVALESTLISHGLPRGRNIAAARQIEANVREAGAIPATIAVLDGVVRVGLDDDGLAAIAGRNDVVKAGIRDLAPLVARGGHGATTVAATAHIADLAGIAVFATGGLGGVHRHARETWDESADLPALAATGVTVVCAGVKSILDVAATLERLETLSVTVIGYGTDAFPGFYLADSGHPAPWRADSPEEVAAIVRARHPLGLQRRGVVIANPVATSDQLDPAVHARVLDESLAAAAVAGIRGREVTPFLLERFHRETGGASLEINVAIVLANARLGALIALALSRG